MNAAVRAVVRMSITCGAKVYLIHEVSIFILITTNFIEMSFINSFVCLEICVRVFKSIIV